MPTYNNVDMKHVYASHPQASVTSVTWPQKLSITTCCRDLKKLEVGTATHT